VDENDNLIIGGVQGTVELKMSSGKQMLVQCHLNNAQSTIYSSNAVGIFTDRPGAVSGGGDGQVAIFNLNKGIRTSEKAITNTKIPITAIATSPRNGFYAVAVGYD
jgi:hypothetical protein